MPSQKSVRAAHREMRSPGSGIYLIRGEKVMFDSDLAQLYQVKAIALRQQVKRNIGRFPEDFMFQLNAWPGIERRCQLFKEWG